MTKLMPLAALGAALAHVPALVPAAHAETIVGLWFANYKGPDGGMESQGFAEADVAREVFDAAAAQFSAGD